MITKKQFCELKIEEFCAEKNIKKEEITEEMILESSTLAVCMEYMGLIKQEDCKNYASNRAGIMYLYANSDKTAILSIREFIELLPEAI